MLSFYLACFMFVNDNNNNEASNAFNAYCFMFVMKCLAASARTVTEGGIEYL